MVYADTVKNITIVGPNARIRFEAIKEAVKDGDKTNFETEETLTLVLPVPALGKLADILEDLKQQIEQQVKQAQSKAEEANEKGAKKSDKGKH